MSKRPTDKQRQFAAELGIDVTCGMTRAELSALIGNVLSQKRAESAGFSNLPPDAAQAVFGHRAVMSSEAYAKAATDFLRQHGIREGCIIEVRWKEYCGERLFVVRPFLPGPRWRLMACQSDYTFSDKPIVFWSQELGGYKARIEVEVIYTPPLTHVHPKCLHFADYTSKKYLLLRHYLDKHLTTAERLQTPYGEFWSREAVERLSKQRQSEEEARLAKRYSPSPPRSRPVPVLSAKHCIQCGRMCSPNGQSFADWSKWHRCNSCRDNTDRDRSHNFCQRCGTQFLVNGHLNRRLCAQCKDD